MTVFAAAAAGILVTMGLALARAVIGPTVYDRILAVNAVGTKTVLMIAVLGFLGGRPEFLDIALVYALINFIGTIAVLKFRRYGDLGQAGPRGEARSAEFHKDDF
jgi:multicomponent Na+:H+ antiporter subunit F